MKLTLPSVNSVWNDTCGDYIITKIDKNNCILADPFAASKTPRICHFSMFLGEFFKLSFNFKDKRICK